MKENLRNIAALDKSGCNESVLDFLNTEYSSLVNLYTHTEDSISNVFNFYLTLLSAIIGLVVVLIQLNNTNITSALPSISVLLAFTSLIGIIMQDAIVNKNVEISRYVLALNLLKKHLLKSSEEAMTNVLYMSYYYAKISPIPIRKTYWTDRIHQYFWWLFPLGTQQLFIAVINSFALTALTLIVAEFLTANPSSILRLSALDTS
jgi:hypothetical protein